MSLSTIRLGDHVLKIGSGATPRGGKEVYLNIGTISFIRSQNIYNNSFEKSGLVYLTEEQAEELSNVEVCPDDILLNITGDSVARVCQVPNNVLPARVNQHVAIVRPIPEKINAGFLRYFLVSSEMQTHMLGLAASGATRPALTKGMIENFKIPFFSIENQKAIAGVLGALDHKIELNRRMNATLEAMARALFKSWFVNFDPVRAKMEGKQPFGMDAATAALFPSRLTPSPLGDIPEGWGIRTIGEVTKTSIGRTPPRKEQACFIEPTLGGMPWLSIRDMASSEVYSFSSSEHLTKEAMETYRVPVVEPNTVVVSFKLTVGRVAITGQHMATNEAIAHLNLLKREIISNLYLYCFMKQYDYSQLASTSSIATAVNSESIRDIKLLVPCVKEQQAFHCAVEEMFHTIQCNQHETRKLENLRDYLLPKLISGDIRIPDAEKLMEVA